MTPAEAQVLLSMAAAVDNRKPDPETAKAWAGLLDGFAFDDCRVAIADHFKACGDYLTPYHIRERVLARRRQRRIEHLRTYGPLQPPSDLDDAEQRAWLREALNRVSNGEHVDCTPTYELVEGSVRELLAAATPTTTEEDS